MSGCNKNKKDLQKKGGGTVGATAPFKKTFFPLRYKCTHFITYRPNSFFELNISSTCNQSLLDAITFRYLSLGAKLQESLDSIRPPGWAQAYF